MRGAPPEYIHAAPVERLAVILLILRVSPVPDSRRLVGFDARTSDFRIQQAGHRQRIVANELSLELQPRAAGKQPVVGILFKLLGVDRGRLTVGRACDDEANQSLHIPRLHRT